MLNDDGSTLDTSTTTIPQAVLQLGIDAVAAAYGWQSTVPNPEYATPVVDDTILATIPNPVTAARHMAFQWRMFTIAHVQSYSQIQLVSAQAALAASIAAMEAQVVTQ